MNSMDQKKRVFWHEAGHLVAAHYNTLHYGWLGTESITIIRQTAANNRIDYWGKHEPRKPKDYNPKAPIKQPAAKIASLAYGCIFQAILLDEPLINCFDQNIYANGYDDFRYVAGVAAKSHIYPPDTQPIYKCIEDHFEKIKDNEEFVELFAQDITELIHSDECLFTIDVQEVEKKVATFLSKHEAYYINLVQQLEEIFEYYKTC